MSSTRVLARPSLIALALLMLVSAPIAHAVDGVIEINQARALAGGVTPDDTAGLPVTISAPGSYVLTGDLSSTGANETIIEITTNDVTLDLNGFTIRCIFVFNPCAGTGAGRGINGSNMTNVTVRNGTVRDMPSDGIKLGNQARIDKVQALSNGGDGMMVMHSSSVYASVADSNGSAGIQAAGGSVIEGNVTTSNDFGISLSGRGNLIRRNAIKANTRSAIRASLLPSFSGYVDNVIIDNNGTDVGADGDQGISAIPLGTNICGTDTTCP